MFNFLFSLFLSGLLESSTRLKPHEAQNYRKKALWVSWFSIIVTLALAVAAFSEYQESCWSIHACLILQPLWDTLLLLVDYYWWVNFFRWLDSQHTYKLVKWLLCGKKRYYEKETESSPESFGSHQYAGFVEADSGCQMNSDNILLVDAFNLGWHEINIYPWDLCFEPNGTRLVQYRSEPSSLFPYYILCKVYNKITCTF